MSQNRTLQQCVLDKSVLEQKMFNLNAKLMDPNDPNRDLYIKALDDIENALCIINTTIREIEQYKGMY